MDAHLVLERAAGHRVACAHRAVLVHEELRHHEERDALGARRRTLDPGDDEVDDVLRQVVIARRDEDLGAGEAVGAVAVRHRLGLEEPEIRAAMRLGQVHGAGPGALDHLGQVGGLLLLRAVDQQRGDRALRQAGIHAEREVGAGAELLDRRVEHVRQALAAEFLRHGQPHPAAGRVGVVGRLEALRRDDAAVLAAGAPLLIARQVQRRQDFLGELAALVQHRLDHVRRGLGEAGQVVVAVDREDVVEEEKGVLDRGPVARHRVSLPHHCRSSRARAAGSDPR
ncbi:hypothetical protein CHKEEEPN_4798 [Methylorubrum podarium]|nr:hypothetical protein CHKEEEPN_4798 [Methylorubrum podarium]